jgi:hypothetical protein
MHILDIHSRMTQAAGPAPVSPLGNKPKDLRARREEAARLSRLMAANPGFSFLRLGDMELTCLLAAQEGLDGNVDAGADPTNGTVPYGHPGIGLTMAPALLRSYEKASYVDTHERIWPNSQLVSKLKLKSVPGQQRNPDAETSLLMLTWMEFEFRNYCRGRKVGLAGAEAALLQQLLTEEEFGRAAEAFWPKEAEVCFHQIRDDGRNLSTNLDLIQEDLRAFVKATGIDTLFLSLGGAGKILCVELAEELGVRTFDAGSMLRALTYSGSDGNRAARATHFPFLYRVPFPVWCDGMERTWPGLAPHERLAKVHAQLILEVQRKETGWTYASSELDLSEENRAAFHEAWKIYYRRYASLFKATTETRKERIGFLHFCGTHGLTGEGKRFYRVFQTKSWLKRLLSPGKIL